MSFQASSDLWFPWIGLLWSLPIMATLSLGVTGAFLRYALAHRLMEIPNARSSHSIPTPRSGGVGIVLTFLIALPLAGMLGAIGPNLVWSLSGAGAGIALLGFIDDHRPIAARWRLLGHFAGSLWALFWLGGLPALEVFGMTLELGWIGHALAVVYLVWMLNLYNFMDGIDGIASVEAVTSCLSICLIYWLSGYDDLIWPPLLLATSTLGFLYWNFPPAKIFMGDIGSGFLGIVLGILSLQAAWRNADFLWVWCILLGVFIVDATFTLIRRFLRGERIYEAHRSHGYQFASRQLGSHFQVTLGVASINLLWLLPIGLFVAMQKLDGGLGVIVAYVPLLILAVKYRAGESERRAE